MTPDTQTTELARLIFGQCRKCRQVLETGCKVRLIGTRTYHEECYRKLVRNQAQRARHAAYTDLGLKRVKGALGGVYYE